MLLQVKNLSKRFHLGSSLFKSSGKTLHALTDVSFDLKEGETLGLVGESGSGKSTLGRTILRLYEPDTGEVHFCGKDMHQLSGPELRDMRKNMQMVFQDPYSSLNPKMRIGDILAEPFLIHKMGAKTEIAAQVEELIRIVGLQSEALTKYPSEFSGGQRQRIGIARAIALRPKLIIADEPVSALDVSIQSQILNLLMDLREKMSLSYLFIAHDLAVIKHISHRVAVMYLGRIVEMATSDELFENPLHPYTKALMASIPRAEYSDHPRESRALTGDIPSPLAPPSGCAFHPRCSLATDLCKEKRPEFREKDGGRKVACHYG